MTVHPFIEAEKRAGHSVKRSCELLKVSRAAFYARRVGTSGPRAVRDAELTEQITTVHQRSRGTYGAPRVHAVLQQKGTVCGRRRIARLMRAAGLVGRHRRRRHRTTIPDPRAAARTDLVVRDFQPDPAATDARWCGDITPSSPPMRAGCNWPPASTSPPAGWSAGLPPTMCAPSWWQTPYEPPVTSAAPQMR
ncbi:IS3 family transposase [Streptomyces acidicola]|uniref:IS3 family transposase n=1 Tax=Streptomyces acidicola TaxID=2596892 RepID=UPI00342BD03B